MTPKVALSSAGYPLTSRQHGPLLGSDARPEGSRSRARTRRPGRSDTIMLLRVGGGTHARLSIPRDTLVDIPGHGRQKINAAYAFGGAALVDPDDRAYLGIASTT